MSILKVAESAGVSHTTVSRVINNRPGVSVEVVRRVKEAMDRIGYTPPVVRRGPQARGREGVKTGTAAMLIFGATPTLAMAPVAARVLHALEETLTDEGWGLVLGQVNEAGRLPPAVLAGRVDGLFLYGHPPAKAVADQIRHLPSVWLLSQRSSRGHWGNRVQPDNDAIGRIAAEYLVAQDCRNVAFLHLDRSHLGFGQRADAFAQTATERGVTQTVLPDDRRGDADPADPAWIATQVDRMLAMPDRPDGIFLPRVAPVGVLYRTLRSRGIEPGRDIKVITCDQDSILSALDPQPATIDVCPGMVGRQAAKLLLWQLESGAEPVRTTQMIEPKLVEPDVLLPNMVVTPNALVKPG